MPKSKTPGLEQCHAWRAKLCCHISTEAPLSTKAPSLPTLLPYSLTVPELRKPGSDEVLLPEATYTASGRGAKDAEQAAARQAVAAAEKAGLAM